MKDLLFITIFCLFMTFWGVGSIYILLHGYWDFFVWLCHQLVEGLVWTRNQFKES